MFARQLANTSRRALAQGRTSAARRGIHLASDPRPYGVMSIIPPNSLPLVIGTTAVSAVGLAAGFRTWLMAPEDFAEPKRHPGLMRF